MLAIRIRIAKHTEENRVASDRKRPSEVVASISVLRGEFRLFLLCRARPREVVFVSASVRVAVSVDVVTVASTSPAERVQCVVSFSP